MPRRRLTPIELAEARLVFGSGLDYARAYVFEGARWTDLVDEFGAILQRRQRGLLEHNAITLGNTSYFPIPIRTSEDVLRSGDYSHITWLIHELTHQWQYQRVGWRYLASALKVQLREGRRSYDYQREHPTREAALRAAVQGARQSGRLLRSFNLEQQGDIARDYYLALKRGLDSSAWEPLIQELRELRA